ncbi:MAG TPA: hypothetical protein VML54_10720 [Candidatus Limnocylindrales bacterium]|nr:hypothetical protein [Candidatus Limnocylindrales bacterium]
MRREQRYRNHQAPQAALPRVFAHDLAIGDLIRAAGLEDPRLRRVEVDRLQQVRQHVLDRDRLRQHTHPSRADHDGQPLDQRAHHLEGQAPRPDDDRGAQLDHLDAGGAQQVTRLVPAPQVLGQVAFARTQSAQVDEAADAGAARGGGEGTGGPAVLLLEVGAGAHGMDQVEGRVYALHGGSQRTFVPRIRRDDLRVRAHALSQRLRSPGHAAHAEAALLEERQQAAPHVARGAGEEDRPLLPGRRRRGARLVQFLLLHEWWVGHGAESAACDAQPSC